MNRQLVDRLRSGASPFDGVTIVGDTGDPVVLVRRALRAIVDCLAGRYPDRILYRLQDSYAQDGLVTTGHVVSWPEVRSWLAADQRLFIARSGEPGVRIGVVPDDPAFYLRFYVDHEVLPGASLGGHYDVTIGEDDVSAVIDALKGADIVGFRRVDPREYFEWRGA